MHVHVLPTVYFEVYCTYVHVLCIQYCIKINQISQGIYIWVCKECPTEVIQAVFGVQHFGAIPESMVSLNNCVVNPGGS